MRTTEGTTIWYLRVIHHLAQNGDVWTLDISGEQWGEVDFPEDVGRCRSAVQTLGRLRSTTWPPRPDRRKAACPNPSGFS